ncbi:MAG: hypothetical protein AB8G99_06585 [Planctomycetaceae bacterium]
MRRTIGILTAIITVGLGTVAQGQQGAEPARLKPGLLGRILGLDSVPNPRLIMQENQRQRAAFKPDGRLSVGAPPVSKQQPTSNRPVSNRAVSNRSSVLSSQRRPTMSAPSRTAPTQPPKLRRTTSNNGRTVSSFTEVSSSSSLPTITPSSGVMIQPRKQSTSQLSLANILRNRQSQPMNEVTRIAPRMRNPFLPSSDDVYQPIASGPVPIPAVMVVEDAPEPELPEAAPLVQPLAIPMQDPVGSEPEIAAAVAATAEPKKVAAPAMPAPTTQQIVVTPVPETASPVVAEAQKAQSVKEPVSAPQVADFKRPTVPEIPATPEVKSAPVEEAIQLRPVVRKTAPEPTRREATSPADSQFELPIMAGTAPTPNVRKRPSSTPTTRTAAQRVPSASPEQKWHKPRIVQSQTRPVAKPVTRMFPVHRSTTTPATVPAIPVSRVTVTRPIQTDEPKQASSLVVATPPTTQVQATKQKLNASAIGRARMAPAEPAPEQTRPSVQQPRPKAANESTLPVIRPKGYQPPATARPSAVARYRAIDSPSSRSRVSTKTPVQMANGPRRSAAPKIQRTTSRVDRTTDSNAIRPAVQTKSTDLPSRAFSRPNRGVRRNMAIAKRSKLIGFKGFCPVELHDHRQLQNASPQFHATYMKRTYTFSTAAARDKFVANPLKYVPAANGSDVVLLTHTGTVLSGRLDFAAWHKGRLFLFSTQEALDAFNLKPAMYASRF